MSWIGESFLELHMKSEFKRTKQRTIRRQTTGLERHLVTMALQLLALEGGAKNWMCGIALDLATSRISKNAQIAIFVCVTN